MKVDRRDEIAVDSCTSGFFTSIEVELSEVT